MRTARQHHRAFTLIEAIACVVMLAILIPPTLWSMREGHRQRINPVLASRARWLATEKLEDVIADRNSTTRGYDYLVSGNYPTESSISGFPGFTRSVAFTETGVTLSGSGSGYMNVAVSVAWSDATATPRTFVLTTVLTEYE